LCLFLERSTGEVLRDRARLVPWALSSAAPHRSGVCSFQQLSAPWAVQSNGPCAHCMVFF